MKKSLVSVILALSVFFRPIDVFAASSCSYSEQAELNNIAANVKVAYDVVEVYKGKLINPETDEEFDSYNKGLKINILNVSDEITIKVTNNKTKEVKNFTSKDAQNGIISFDHNDVTSVTNYNIEVIANKYSCAGDLIRKIDFIAPMYNSYSELAICNEHPEFYYCQEFIADENVDYNTFINKVEDLREEDEKKQKEEQEEKKGFLEKIKELYKRNKLVINITGSVIVVGGLTTAIILIKKRRSRVL